MVAEALATHACQDSDAAAHELLHALGVEVALKCLLLRLDFFSWIFYTTAMASTPRAMASNLIAMASTLI